jgi:hypothetical protein
LDAWISSPGPTTRHALSKPPITQCRERARSMAKER